MCGEVGKVTFRTKVTASGRFARKACADGLEPS